MLDKICYHVISDYCKFFYYSGAGDAWACFPVLLRKNSLNISHGVYVEVELYYALHVTWRPSALPASQTILTPVSWCIALILSWEICTWRQKENRLTIHFLMGFSAYKMFSLAWPYLTSGCYMIMSVFKDELKRCRNVTKFVKELRWWSSSQGFDTFASTKDWILDFLYAYQLLYDKTIAPVWSQGFEKNKLTHNCMFLNGVQHENSLCIYNM